MARNIKPAKELECYTMSEVIDHLVDEVQMDHDISRTLAKQLVLNALTYNIVANEVYSMSRHLLLGEEDADV